MAPRVALRQPQRVVAAQLPQPLGAGEHRLPCRQALSSPLSRGDRRAAASGIRGLQPHARLGSGRPALDGCARARCLARRAAAHARLLRARCASRDDWGFVCASLDQGFFFYMMRIRSALGSDLGRVCSLGSHEKAPEPRMRAKLRHYAGGVKPEEALALASRCSHGGALVMGAKPRSKFWRLLRPAAERKLRGIAQEIARTLSWGERTRALGSQLLSRPEATAPRDFDRLSSRSAPPRPRGRCGPRGLRRSARCCRAAWRRSPRACDACAPSSTFTT